MLQHSKLSMSRNRFLDPYNLSMLQRAVLIPYFGIGSLVDPTRGELVAALGDVTAHPVILRKLVSQLKNNKRGRDLLKAKPLINTDNLNIPYLRSLPIMTFGRQYAQFMDHHGFSADERANVRFMVDEDQAYVVQRYRQIHDFWHVLSGIPPSVLGEVALKCFEFRVTGLPVCALATVLGPLRLTAAENITLASSYVPWAIRAGGKCSSSNLLSFPYEQFFESDIEGLRVELNFELAPSNKAAGAIGQK